MFQQLLPLARMVALRNTFEELHDSIMGYCYQLLTKGDLRGDIMCPGIIDSYGPHVSTNIII